jgi:hypothetical protein
MPLPDLDDDNEFEVEEVKDKSVIKGQVYYLVKWEGWPTEYNQWIPEEDMGDAKGAIRQFENRQKKQNKAN